MLNLDPTKLLIIAVVAVILLGPDKLPQVGRQAGAAWRTFNDFRHRMETEVRNSIPDLPSSADIARMARSPSALLNHLSTLSPEEAAGENGAADGNGAAGNGAVANGTGAAVANGASTNGAAGETSVNGNGTTREVATNGVAGADGADESVRTSADPSGAESHSEQVATPAPDTPTMPTAPMSPMPPISPMPSQPSSPPTGTPAGSTPAGSTPAGSTPAGSTPAGTTLPGPGAVGDPSLN